MFTWGQKLANDQVAQEEPQGPQVATLTQTPALVPQQAQDTMDMGIMGLVLKKLTEDNVLLLRA